MLSVEENERISHVGPGTPMGELLRRYWQPIAAVQELDDEEVVPLRRLGENLVLFKTTKGAMGLVQERCPHRSASLAYGIPDEEGIRCPYHGWYYSPDGRCLEQPYDDIENPDNTFKDKITVDAYPVEAMGGLVWAYMGPPEKKPLLPQWEGFVREGVNRTIGVTNLPCNWLQCMENSLDPVHFEWLHANLINYVAKRRGEEPRMFPARHVRIAFDVFEYGIYKRRLLEGDDPETSPDWLIGHPILFPNTLAFKSPAGGTFQIRVPIDDHNTWHILYGTGLLKDGETEPTIKVSNIPHKHDNGRLVVETVIGTDMMAWVSQGPLTPRQHEHLGVSDRGVILYRSILSDAIDAVARGEDPPGVIFDPAKNPPYYRGEDDLGQARAAFNIPGRDNSQPIAGAPEPQERTAVPVATTPRRG